MMFRTLFSSSVRRIVTIATIVTAACFASTPAHAWVYSTSAQWGSWSGGGFTVYNDIWSGEGNQTLNVNSGSSWQVVSSNMNGGGVKAYGNSSYILGKNSLTGYAGAYFDGNCTASAYDMSFDIWSNGSVDEIMLWMQWGGAVGPIGSEVASNVNVGGWTWNIYRGNTGHNVVSLLNTSKPSSGDVDIMSIFQYLNSKGWLSSASIYQVQFGFEITTTSGTDTSNCYGYSHWQG